MKIYVVTGVRNKSKKNQSIFRKCAFHSGFYKLISFTIVQQIKGNINIASLLISRIMPEGCGLKNGLNVPHSKLSPGLGDCGQ